MGGIIREFVRACRQVGGRMDLVQGAGGNISLKLDSGRMLVKASGIRLRDVSERGGYVVSNHGAIRSFYAENPDYGGKAASICMSANSESATGLRPSMETAFHSFLGKAVIHTHPALVNVIACAKGGMRMAARVFDGFEFPVLRVPYRTPGHELARELFTRVEQHPGADAGWPLAIVLQNHGLIASGKTLGQCIGITAAINGRVSAYLRENNAQAPPYPKQRLSQLGGFVRSTNPLAMEASHDLPLAKKWLRGFLFPDAAVYCGEGFSFPPTEGGIGSSRISVLKGRGILYPFPMARAMMADELVTASLYVSKAIGKIGKPRYLGPGDIRDLLALPAEKYRKSLCR